MTFGSLLCGSAKLRLLPTEGPNTSPQPIMGGTAREPQCQHYINDKDCQGDVPRCVRQQEPPHGQPTSRKDSADSDYDIATVMMKGLAVIKSAPALLTMSECPCYDSIFPRR